MIISDRTMTLLWYSLTRSWLSMSYHVWKTQNRLLTSCSLPWSDYGQTAASRNASGDPTNISWTTLPNSKSYAVITIAIRLRHDYDTTTTYCACLLTIRRKQKMNMSVFRRSRIVVVSQSNRTQIVIFVVVERVVVSSYRSRMVVESQLWYRL